MAWIRPSLDHDEKGHQALDKIVLRAFKLHMEVNQEPDWPTFLSTIVNNGKRLDGITWGKRMNCSNAKALYVMTVLQKGWIDLSFGEVRRLGMPSYSLPYNYHC